MNKLKFTIVFFSTLGAFLLMRFIAASQGVEANGWFYPVALTFALAFGFVASLKQNGEV